MKKIPLISFVLIVLLTSFKWSDLNLQTNLEWKNVKINPSLQIPQIEENDWSYPWYMVKHENEFENTFGEPITAEDTVRLTHNSRCYTYNKKIDIHKNEPRSRLKFAKLNYSGDTLKIEVYDESASNWEFLKFKILDDKFQVNYKTAYVFPYEEIRFEILNQSLTLNQPSTPKINQTLKGKCSVEILETIDYLDKSESNVRVIEGTFEVKVK